jgi:predicted RNase H-like HicB family nuclease
MVPLSDRATAMDLTAVYVKVPEGYIAFVEELSGANTRGADMREVKENLKEAVALILAENRRQSKRA